MQLNFRNYLVSLLQKKVYFLQLKVNVPTAMCSNDKEFTNQRKGSEKSSVLTENKKMSHYIPVS